LPNAATKSDSVINRRMSLIADWESTAWSLRVSNRLAYRGAAPTARSNVNADLMEIAPEGIEPPTNGLGIGIPLGPLDWIQRLRLYSEGLNRGNVFSFGNYWTVNWTVKSADNKTLHGLLYEQGGYQPGGSAATQTSVPNPGRLFAGNPPRAVSPRELLRDHSSDLKGPPFYD